MNIVKIIVIILLVVFALGSCESSYNNVDDYHMIYDNVTEANKTFTEDRQKDTLLAWEGYAYCSYLLLFPREQPENMNEFEYYWSQAFDYDNYSIYFTYTLDEDVYLDFKQSMSEFSISYEDQINKPIYTETLFEYPAYILSWTGEVENGGLCEYVMLDDQNCTVINVFKMFCHMDDVQKSADYNILPKDNNYIAVDELCSDIDYAFAKNSGYTVYAFYDENNELFVPSVEEMKYDREFIDNV